MMIFLAVIVFILIFSSLVLIHELGHFWAAKAAGIKVEEFGMGLPPKIWGFKPAKSETVYSINAIPFGGFVRLYGEDKLDGKGSKNARMFNSQPLFWKVVVVCAGVLMNFLLAWVLLMIGYGFGMKPLYLSQDDFFKGIRSGNVLLQEGKLEGKEQISLLRPVILSADSAWIEAGLRPEDELMAIDGQRILSKSDLENSLKSGQVIKGVYRRDGQTADFAIALPAQGLVVTEIMENSPAKKLDLRVGDQILSVNGLALAKVEDYTKARKLDSQAVKLTVLRDGQKTEINSKLSEKELLGIYLSDVQGGLKTGLNYYFKPVDYSILELRPLKLAFWQIPLQALSDLFRLAYFTILSFLGVITSLFSTLSVPESIAGPVGIAQMTYVYLQEGVLPLVQFAALLSLSLAVINILPFPGLDGGRLALILIPAIFNRKLDGKLEAYINVIGFFLLIALIFAVTFNDLWKLFF